ncbi:unnamed protein product [Rhizopus stolonifer]
MKSLTLLVAAAAFASAVSAQHHGGLDHLDHDLGLGHDHDRNHDRDHDYQPKPDPPQQLDYEIQTKAPIVVLTTVTMTKPWAIVHHQKTKTHEAAPTYDEPEEEEPTYEEPTYEKPTHEDREHKDHDGPHRPHNNRGHLRQNVRVNSVVPESDGHLAAAAISASAAPVKSVSRVNQAVSSSVSSPASSAAASLSSTSGANTLRMGGGALVVSAIAWLFI